MKRSTRYQFRYSWTKMLVDAIWLTITLTIMVKVVEGLTA